MAVQILGLKCDHCGKMFEDATLFVCSNCEFPLSITYEYDQISGAVNKKSFELQRSLGIWRYSAILPEISSDNRVTLGEGQTPLVEVRKLGKELGLRRLYAKLDCLNPTGSFKDRGSAVGVSFALEKGFTAVGCTSSGNMAASLSAYGAKAALKVLLFVPSYAAKEKLIQASAYGAEIVGTAEMPNYERYRLSHNLGRELGIFMINNNSPFRIEGQKTFSFEVSEDLDWDPPDWVVVPTSSGGNTYAIIKGFREMKTLGLTNKLPRILVAQSSGCAPIVKAFKEGKLNVDRWPKPESVASAILNPFPPSGERILAFLAKDGGSAATASDEEIIRAVKDLASEGIFCEPSSATTLATLRKAVTDGTVHADESVVLDITGIGFKDLRVAQKLYAPPVDLKEFISRRSSHKS